MTWFEAHPSTSSNWKAKYKFSVKEVPRNINLFKSITDEEHARPGCKSTCAEVVSGRRLRVIATLDGEWLIKISSKYSKDFD